MKNRIEYAISVKYFIKELECSDHTVILIDKINISDGVKELNLENNDVNRLIIAKRLASTHVELQSINYGLQISNISCIVSRVPQIYSTDSDLN